MNNNQSYIERLGITTESKLKVDGVTSKIEIKKNTDIIWIINGIKKYIIDNIAQLLMINPEFDDISIQEKIETIMIRDKAISLLECELIGEGKPYIIVDGKVWYSYGIAGSKSSDGKKTNTFYPSATYITNNVLNFKPINRYFSQDGERVYYTYHTVGNVGISPDINTFQAIGETSYGHDDENLYCGFNQVLGADISNGITIISEEKEIIRDSNNVIFYGHERVDIENPEELSHSCSNFFFDGINVYLFYGTFSNITKLYELKEGENITRIEGDNYKIGDKLIEYKESKFIVKDNNL